MAAVASWDARPTPGVSYNLYRNGLLVKNTSELSATVEKADGDEYFVRAVLNGIESNDSSRVIVPHGPSNLKITIIIEGK